MKTLLDEFDELIVSVNHVAYVLNMSARNVQLLAEQGIVKRVARGQYRLKESLHAYIDHLRDQVAYYSGGESAGNILGGSQ